VKFYMLYRKKFYPREHFEVSPEDGAKTRALIRDHVEVKELEDAFPTYVLDENYLTKIDALEPDAKALDIEAMLDAEIRVRLGGWCSSIDGLPRSRVQPPPSLRAIAMRARSDTPAFTRSGAYPARLPGVT
jgi:hypothetical protein